MDQLNKKDKIDIYKDKELLDLAATVMPALESESLNFLLSKMKVDENGRTIRHVMIDKVATLEEINKILESRYKDNIVAGSYIAVNNFTITTLKEDIEASDNN